MVRPVSAAAGADVGGLGQAVGPRMLDLYADMVADASLPHTLRDTTEVVRQAMHAERATTYLVREATRELESVALTGAVARTIRIPISDESLAGYCALTRRCFVVPDAYGNLRRIDSRLRFDKSWDRANNFRTRDVLCAPAMFGKRLLGVVQVINSLGNRFRKTDLVRLQTLSRLVAFALHHARVLEERSGQAHAVRVQAEALASAAGLLDRPVELLREGLARVHGAAPEPGDEPAFEQIRRGATELATVAEEFRLCARLRGEDALGKVAVWDVAVEAAATADRFVATAEEKGLKLTAAADATGLPVRIDREAFRASLGELLTNAVKYTPAGIVEVDAARSGEWAEVRVRDSGIGIPEQDIPKLFSCFFRGTNVRETTIPGTGTGLAGVKEAAARFGGDVAVESHEGRGTTVILRLPLSRNSPGSEG